MSTAMAERPTAPVVTAEELDLIKRTIAPDATPAELKLFLYDNARQHVHPLDKLIHFTKRRSKYVPITSIDFMRMRAADTGECAGIEDAKFVERGSPPTHPDTATVTVWRLVQGQRCPFTATARWTEYKPDDDWMWRKMPYGQLGKCAEALALRKGFPKQLHGLYEAAEMDQAGNRQRPAHTSAPDLIDASTEAPDAGSPPSPGDDATVVNQETGEELVAPAPGYHYLTHYTFRNGWHEADVLHWDAQGASLHVSTKTAVGMKLQRAANENIAVRVKVRHKPGRPGEAYLDGVYYYEPVPDPAGPPPVIDEPITLTDEDVPF